MIKLIKLDKQYKKEFIDFMNEWTNSKERIIPYILTRIDYNYFDIFIRDVETIESNKLNTKCELFFCYDSKMKVIVGAVCIRRQLTESLFERGGHIALGIRPLFRNRGYGTKLVQLSIEKCCELGINNILFVCEKDNIYSSRTIIKNNGKLENEIQLQNTIIQRYWVKK